MRRHLVGLAILIGGVLGMFACWLLVEALSDRVLGPGHSPFDLEPPMQLLLLAPWVLLPLLVAGLLLPRGRTNEVGLFLMGWGCLWPIFLVYWTFETVAARLTGGLAPQVGLIGGPGPLVCALFFAVLPLLGLWLATAGLRQRRANRIVSQS